MSDPKATGTSVIDPETVGEILVPGTPEEQSRQEARVRRSFFATAKRALSRIPFMDDVVASYFCATDPQTPPAARGILLAALAYFVLPIDIVPDFLFGLGFVDDAAVLLAAFRTVRDNIRPEHYDRARATLAELREA
jgi:uncharacterized membrane protein YkvA (DUF1232 family)